MLAGFRAANVVRVELPVEAGSGDRIGQVIDAAIGAGANTVEGIEFEIADPQPHQVRALELASRRAREKAEGIARALGVETGRLLEAREAVGELEPPRPFLAMEKSMAAATPVSPGELVLRATVSVRYEVRGR